MSADQITTAETALGQPPARRGETRILGPLAVGLALLSAFATFVVLADLTPIAPTYYVVVSLLLANAATVILLLTIIVREVWQVVHARRTGRAAARLHVRIVGLFSIIAAAPAILVAIVASVTLDRGLDRLFSTRTRAAIENSLIVAEAYLRDHAAIVRSDILVMSTEISRSKSVFEQDHTKLRQYLTFQASLRGLAATIVIDKDLNIIARDERKINQTFAMPPRDALAKIGDSDPQIVLLPDTNYVAAVVKLKDFDDDYLYVTRLLDPSVVPQLQATRESVTEYAAIESRRLGVQVAFALMYTVIALTVLLSAVWIGLNFANRLVAPIRRLIGAANVVSTGNLHVRAPMMSSRWVRSSWVMRLKVSPSCARSPSDWCTGTRTCRLPVDTTLAAPISRRIGATRRLAKSNPTHTADNRTVSAMTVYISANAICTPRRRASIAAYSFTLSRVACNCGTTFGSSSRVT